jgi:acetyltransferase-like isoleucine patch superfamily enzyme
MKKILKFFGFIPFVGRLNKRKYYATGIGTYLVNSFFKKILGIGRNGDYLLHFTSRVNSPENLIIKEGKDNASVYLSLATSGGCYYQAINGIEIGEGTIWSYNCSFISANHSFHDLKKHKKTDPISIGEYVWIGANCVILPSVLIGKYSIIGAGSVVTKSIPEYSIAVGNPAEIIARRCPNCLKKIGLKETCSCKIK